MESIEKLKKTVYGLEGIFLLQDKEVVSSDFLEEEIKITLKSLSYLIDIVRENRDVKKLFVAASDRKLFVYIKNNIFLGIVCKPETNVPLLNIVSNKILEEIEVLPKEEEPKRSEREFDKGFDAF
ncbi:MAG: hypothetical protein ACE5K0_11265 [Candidatus Methanofastidiosia archaeon]